MKNIQHKVEMFYKQVYDLLIMYIHFLCAERKQINFCDLLYLFYLLKML